MYIQNSNIKIVKIKYIIFKAWFQNKYNLKNSLKIIHLIKKYYRNTWNSRANRFVEMFILLSDHEVGK